ncbi:MAG: selenocysteine-specific translation elongation factor [Ilumatobacteraceae bacterium]
MRIIATAGHVDHGKSTLVRALTGIDPDRWQEEKDRGLTIDLGFAHLTADDHEGLSFIDVPGHVRFLANMLAGLGGIHGCLFVVDAHEGWMPQSEEHLRILHLLGIDHGVVALTKIDLCTTDECQLATLDIADRLAGSSLENAPIIGVSSVTGEGLDELVSHLRQLASTAASSVDHRRPRLFIDRVFAAKGSGTVVTGTLTHGSLSVGEQIAITPSSRPARIRSIQTLGRSVDRIAPGHRVALNLSGVDHHDIVRGNAVIAADRWFLTDRFDAELTVLASLDHAVSRRGAYAVHIGSDQIPATVRVLGPDTIAPGNSQNVRVQMARVVPLLPGDRFILRESGRSETVGGGEILDIDPQRPAATARPDRSIERVVNERGWITSHDLDLLTGIMLTPTVGPWIVDPDLLQRLRDDLTERIRAAGSEGVDLTSLDERLRRVLDLLDDIDISDGRVRRKDLEDPLLRHPVLAELEAQGCAPHPPTSASPGDLRRLQQRGLLVEREGLWFHHSAVERARRAAQTLLTDHPDGFTMSQFRESLGITRKHAVPLATELDGRGITRRRDDVRIAGPRLYS